MFSRPDYSVFLLLLYRSSSIADDVLLRNLMNSSPQILKVYFECLWFYFWNFFFTIFYFCWDNYIFWCILCYIFNKRSPIFFSCMKFLEYSSHSSISTFLLYLFLSHSFLNISYFTYHFLCIYEFILLMIFIHCSQF